MFVIKVLAESSLPISYSIYRLIKRNEISKSFKYIFCLILVAAFSKGTMGTLDRVDRITPYIYDQAICSIEFRTFLSMPYLIAVCNFISREFFGLFNFIYDYIILFIFVISSSEVVYAKTSLKNNILIRFAVGGLLSIPLYIAVPAIGPVFYTHFNYPFQVPDVSTVKSFAVFFKNQQINRNSMPSLHATWVILCFLALRTSPLWHRILGALYVTVTFVFTLGFGFHYLLDWVVALPLVLFIRSITSDCEMHGIRVVSIIVSAIYIFSWIYILRNTQVFIKLDAFLDILIVSTIVVPVWLEYKMNKEENSEVEVEIENKEVAVFG